jgi:hypothetical protein
LPATLFSLDIDASHILLIASIYLLRRHCFRHCHYIILIFSAIILRLIAFSCRRQLSPRLIVSFSAFADIAIITPRHMPKHAAIIFVYATAIDFRCYFAASASFRFRFHYFRIISYAFRLR